MANTAVIMCERESSDAAGAYPITPSTQMGEYWAEATATGHINISGRPLIFIEPEGEHAAAGVTAGMSMSGLRATNFSSGQGVAYMHESLYAAVGKRLPYLLNLGCRAMTKSTLNVHAGHDDYHLMDDTGFVQVFGKNAQEVADLNVITRKIAELSLTPGVVAQDGFPHTHLIETLRIPERELIAEYLGKPEDMIDCPTPAQRILYGKSRRRIPILWMLTIRSSPDRFKTMTRTCSLSRLNVLFFRSYSRDCQPVYGGVLQANWAFLCSRLYIQMRRCRLPRDRTGKYDWYGRSSVRLSP